MGITYNDILQDAKKLLNECGIADAGVDAWYLLTHTFGIDRTYFLLHRAEQLPDVKVNEYRKLVKMRSLHIPLQHITGTQEFMGLEFDVDENVLIPRQDTECLVEEVLKKCSQKTVLDLCTGSGCIIICLEKLGNISKGVGTDISEKALKVAERNARKHNSDITLLQSDLFEKVEGVYDIIVSNPPYIKTSEIETLMPEVKYHEPKAALDAGPDGLVFYRRISQELMNYLKKGGYIFFEIGCDQGMEVKNILSEKGITDIVIKKDLCGLDRVVYGKQP